MTVKITPEIGQKVLYLYGSGMPQSRVAAEIGVTQSCVSKFLRRSGVRMPGRPELAPGHKWCISCEESLPVGCFWRRSRAADGLCSACKSCMTQASVANRSAMRYRAKQVYGITLEEYDRLRATYEACPICGSTEDLHLDHDEGSGKLRQFICKKCNMGLGLFGHEPERLRAAAMYLEAHR